MKKNYSTSNHLFALIFLSLVIGASSCIKQGKPTDHIVIQQKAEPTSLLPNSSGISSGESNVITGLIFQPLIDIDMFNYEIVPVLAVTKPTITIEEGNRTRFAFDIREEAVWDNGSPVTAEDAAFSAKMLHTIGMAGSPIRVLFEKLTNIIIDPKKPKHIEFVFSDKSVFHESNFSSFRILPRYVYDKGGALNAFSYETLLEKEAGLATNPSFKAYSDSLQSVTYHRNTIVGSGPYSFKKWETMRNVTLERKPNWWGDKITTNKNHYFEANPQSIVFEVVKEETAAIAAIQSKKIDFMPVISADAFLKTNFENIADTFSAPTCTAFYLGFNLQKPALADVKVRQAISHLIDKQSLVKNIMHGYATPLVSMYSSNISLCNKELKDYEFSETKAKELLTQAGWKDSDNDGILDKVIDGKKLPLKINFAFGVTSPVAPKLFAILSENFKKVGIELNSVATDPNDLQKQMREGTLDMWCGGRGGYPFQTSQSLYWNTGMEMNYWHLSDHSIDSLTTAHENEPNEAKRITILKTLQARLHELQPCIYLYTRNSLMVMNKDYEVGKLSLQNPGYWTGSIKKK